MPRSRISLWGWAKNLSEVANLDREILRRCAPQNDNGGGVGATKWRFNAWAKYDDWKERQRRDESRLCPNRIFPGGSREYRGSLVVLEGGSIEVIETGSLFTTEECPAQRGAGAKSQVRARADWEAIFRDYVGATNVLWPGRGITGDDTHGHADDLARFVNWSIVVTVVESDCSDANYEPLQANPARLRKMNDAVLRV